MNSLQISRALQAYGETIKDAVIFPACFFLFSRFFSLFSCSTLWDLSRSDVSMEFKVSDA
ncbi:hypothetical protein BDV19DRAFT_260184 [Aspergillus venezuelensis]